MVLQQFPNSGDEWCYLLQAEMFSQGKLSVPSPPHRAFFDVGWMINNGKFYTHHPPGWPLVLAFGVLAGVPWLLNPLLGAGTLLVLYALGKTMYNAQVAVIAVLLMLGSPFFLFNSASYWPHTSSLLFVSLSLLGFVRGLHNAAPAALIMGGLCGSLSFLIRPLEQVALLLACGLFSLFPAIRRHHGLKTGSIFLGSHVLGVLLLMGYHTLQHGHPLLTGYQVSYGAQSEANILLTLTTWHYIDDYLGELVLWTVPGMPVAAGLYSVDMLRRRGRAGRHWDCLLLLICTVFIGIYALVTYPSLVGYGPRYYYSVFFAVALLAARGVSALLAYMATQLCARLRRWCLTLATGAVVLALGGMFTVHMVHESQQLATRLAFYKTVTAHGLHHAVVFIGAQSGDFEPRDLTRNRLDFQGDVVYALDRGAENAVMMAHYPNRRYFLYTYNAQQARTELQELFP
jgi:4-amino-4-deoxy-L-arabinose transferase-like glycosyltransferase